MTHYITALPALAAQGLSWADSHIRDVAYIGKIWSLGRDYVAIPGAQFVSDTVLPRLGAFATWTMENKAKTSMIGLGLLATAVLGAAFFRTPSIATLQARFDAANAKAQTAYDALAAEAGKLGLTAQWEAREAEATANRSVAEAERKYDARDAFNQALAAKETETAGSTAEFKRLAGVLRQAETVAQKAYAALQAAQKAAKQK